MPYIDHICYEAVGRGRPVVFLHPPALSLAYWQPVVARLVGRCRCIAFDLRGHGGSGLGQRPWTFADAAADLHRLTARLCAGEPPVLVGYSSGTAIALQALLDAPGAYAGLVSLGGFSECTTLHLRTKVGLGLLLARLGLSGLVAAAIAWHNHRGTAHYRAVRDGSRRLQPEALRSFLRETLRVNYTAHLGEIQVPALLVYGAQDTPMHPYGRILCRGLPAARAVLVPGADHRVATRRPDRFAHLVDRFLADPVTAAPRRQTPAGT